MSVKIHNEKNVTIDQILAEADALIDKAAMAARDGLSSERMLDLIWKAHPELSASYPLVIRYIVEQGVYSREAFRQYLQYVESHPWGSHDEYLQCCAKYPAMLQAEYSGSQSAEKTYEDVLAALRKETQDFKDAVDIMRAKERQHAQDSILRYADSRADSSSS